MVSADAEGPLPGDAALLFDLEAARRGLTASEVRIHVLDEPVELPAPVRPGTIGVLWAPAGSELLDEAEAAVLGRNADHVATLARAQFELDEEHLPDDLPTDLATALALAPALGQVRYGARTVVRDAMVLPYDRRPFGHAELAYSGGALRPERFTAVSYPLPGTAPLAFVVVVNPPKLSDVDRRMVETVPADLDEAHIDVHIRATPAAVAGVVATWALNKILDEAYNKTKDMAEEYAKQTERARDEHAKRVAEQRARNQQACSHSCPFSLAETLEGREVGELDPTAGVVELLARRRASLS